MARELPDHIPGRRSIERLVRDGIRITVLRDSKNSGYVCVGDGNEVCENIRLTWADK